MNGPSPLCARRGMSQSKRDTYVYRVSFIYVKVHGGALRLKTARGRYGAILPRPVQKPTSDIKYVDS